MKFRKKVEVVVSIVLFMLFFLLATYLLQRVIGIEFLKNYIASFGSWIPLILLVVIIITSSIGLVFTIPVAIAAILLNNVVAFFISLIGLTIGAIISFFIARFIGREYVEKRYINHVKWLKEYDRHLEERGFLVILLCRFITLIPFEIINIGAGLSRVRFWPYFFGTIIGIIPGTILSIYFVRSTGDIGSLNFIVSCTLMVLFSIVPLLFRKVREIVFNIHHAKRRVK